MPSTLRWNKRSESGVLACSALKEQYRQTILLGAEAASENKHYCSNGDKRQKLSRPLPFCCLVVLLHGSKDLIKERMEKRQEHFMPSDLLDSQFESLEEPDNCEMYSVIKVAVDQTVEEIINEILRALKAKYGIRVSIHSTVWNVASWNLYFSYLHIGGVWNKASSDSWYNIKFLLLFARTNKANWKENRLVNNLLIRSHLGIYFVHS